MDLVQQRAFEANQRDLGSTVDVLVEGASKRDERLLAGKTVLVIAHRMRTVAGADHIVVLENGHVAEQGTPAELMGKGGLYRRMVELQSHSAQWQLNGNK